MIDCHHIHLVELMITLSLVYRTNDDDDDGSVSSDHHHHYHNHHHYHHYHYHHQLGTLPSGTNSRFSHMHIFSIFSRIYQINRQICHLVGLYSSVVAVIPMLCAVYLYSINITCYEVV